MSVSGLFHIVATPAGVEPDSLGNLAILPTSQALPKNTACAPTVFLFLRFGRDCQAASMAAIVLLAQCSAVTKIQKGEFPRPDSAVSIIIVVITYKKKAQNI